MSDTAAMVAVGRLGADLDALVAVLDAGLSGPEEALEVLAGFEAFRNRLALVDHRLLAQIGQHQVAERVCAATDARVLSATLRIAPAEAARRVAAAEAVAPRTSMLGTPEPPRRPMLAAAQAAGEISPEQLAIIIRTLDHIETVDATQTQQAEADLVGYARVFAPAELRRLAARLLEALDPDGTAPDDTRHADLRYLHLRTGRDGMIRLEGRLTAAAGAQLTAVLRPLAAPRPSTEPGPNGGQRPVPDDRSYGQRCHDALTEACARLLRCGLPDTGGIPATVIVTMTEEQLRSRSGTETTATGDPISIPEALRIAAEADIIPVVLSATGQPLHLGRTRRLASPAQTWALHTRDGGCSFPGCTIPPQWCERHHILDWATGGTTDLNNLTLLCGYHHSRFRTTGWTCRIRDDGLPWWTPPRWLDPDQTPLLNTHLRARHQTAA